MNKGARFSTCWRYRYRLWRVWNDALPSLAFVMLNPSTADATTDDATVRKCIGFANRGRYGGIEIANLFAWRATKPRDLWNAPVEPVGPENDTHILVMLRDVIAGHGDVVLAWGTHTDPRFSRRVDHVRAMLREYNVPVLALKINRNGTPAHPLMLAYSNEPREFAL